MITRLLQIYRYRPQSPDQSIFICDECNSSHGGCLYNKELDIHIIRPFRRGTTVHSELILIVPYIDVQGNINELYTYRRIDL